MEPKQIADEAELEAALTSGSFLLFKHSLICPISGRAFAEYRAFLDAHPAARTAWVDVIDQRPLSQAIAQRTGVKHESPQALLFEGGSVAWSASHGGITRDSLATALATQADASGA